MDKAVSKSIAFEGREESELHAEIVKTLGNVIDPETGLDVLRMGVVRNMKIERGNRGYRATLTFRPSSPVCPLAFKLAWDMKKAVQTVDGIEALEIEVQGYNRASELEAVLREKEDEGTEQI
jgi:metal-sulfur cluster biosynthetic enzyme